MGTVKPKPSGTLPSPSLEDYAPPASVREAFPLQIQVQYVATSDVKSFLKASRAHPLALICFDRNAPPPGKESYPVVQLNLPQVEGSPVAEVWMSVAPVTSSKIEGVSFAMNEQILFGFLEIDEPQKSSLETLAFGAYGRLLALTRTLGYPYLLRVWNYFPDINARPAGLTRYQQFCVGRHEAFAEGQPDFRKILPAGSAVGTRSGPLQIYFLACTKPGTHIENPRQVNAYDYPTIYGPRSPSFARATLSQSECGDHLFIAGTASIVGHTSQHIGEPEKQTLETLHNLQALIDHAKPLQTAGDGLGDRHALFKAYIRRPEDLSTVSTILKQHLPTQAQVLCLQGAICRSELLLEIEGILTAGSEGERESL